MDDKIKKLLTDVLLGINNIELYLGSERIFKKYEQNSLLQDAVERNLITIGEAVNSILKIYPTIEISNGRKIVDARNRLTHGYDEIENVQIWSIIIKHLPVLKNEIVQLLKN